MLTSPVCGEGPARGSEAVMRDGANACEFLPWDSSFFGFRIGRIRRERLTRTLMLEVDEWASEHRMDCLYVLSDPEDHPTVDLVHQHGLRLTDVSVTLRLAAESVDDATGWRGDVRPARAADVPALRALAASNHRHWPTITTDAFHLRGATSCLRRGSERVAPATLTMCSSRTPEMKSAGKSRCTSTAAAVVSACSEQARRCGERGALRS